MSDFPDPVFCGHRDSIRTQAQAVLVDLKSIDLPPRLFLRVHVWCESCKRNYRFLGATTEKMRLDRPYLPAPKRGTFLEAPLTLGEERTS